MSWEGLTKNKSGEWGKTGFGIADLRNRLMEALNKK